MIEKLLAALVASDNDAADAVLAEALRLGTADEQTGVLDALIRRKKVQGLCGAIKAYDELPEVHQLAIVNNIKTFHSALREASRSDDGALRLAALKLIALGRQGKLAYILAENLHESDATVSKTALDAMVGLARWIATGTRQLQAAARQADLSDEQLTQLAADYAVIAENRPEIESAVARAMDIHRGRHGPELLRAALLLCDWAGSKTLAILKATKHGGQSAMVRRLQQPPASENIEAFLLGASHGGLRAHFGNMMSRIEEAPVLDALLRKTHWLADHQLKLCMHQTSRGVWWEEHTLLRDIDRRPGSDVALIGEWIVNSGMHDVMQDERLKKLLEKAGENFADRLRLLRAVISRKRGGSVQFIRMFLEDSDERLVRLAAREIIRRRPMDFENILLQKMIGAPESVRKLISRAIGHEGFEQFWNRFDQMQTETRRQAGRAMLKLLPDAAQRLGRRLSGGPVEQRVKALQIVQDMGLTETLRSQIMPLCSHANAKVRSKAVSMLSEIGDVQPEFLLEKAIHDIDPRVRANAIEVLESRPAVPCVPLLAERARSAHNRERANAIKALHTLRVTTASSQLLTMLRDERAEHRISALWTLRKVGWWALLNEVGKIARVDNNVRVRRYALNVLRGAADLFQAAKSKESA